MGVEMVVGLEYLGRIILSGLCGIMIGYERKNRKKEAGVRTHCIVALASALMMIISKYGFFDLQNLSEVKLDPSRVASQIVTGVGFLGAGMIFVHRNNVKGLTTAAGIWATCGIGMAIGAGLYFIGISTAIIIFIVQILLHKNFKILKTQTDAVMNITADNNEEMLVSVQKIFFEYKIDIDNIRIDRLENGLVELEIEGNFNNSESVIRMINDIDNLTFVKSVSI